VSARSITTKVVRCALVVGLLALSAHCLAQEPAVATRAKADTIKMGEEGILSFDDAPLDALADSTAWLADTVALTADSILPKQKAKRDWSQWRPNPKRALWLSLVIPGAGQIYNRKYWKLPIVYGGFVGCIYALTWNNQMYRDYSQAFVDIVDSDPETQSYNQFLHLGAKIDDKNRDRYRELFQKRKDYYRRYRDLSFFVLLGVYALSVVDAYIDASLSDFDINKDLSVHVAPAVINSNTDRNPLRSSAVGLQCSLRW